MPPLCWSSARSAPGGYLARPLSHELLGQQHGVGEGVETGVILPSGGPKRGMYSHAIDDGVEEEFDRGSDDGWDEDDEAGVSLVDLEGTRTYGGEEV
jgi:hypothetical protein